MGTSKIPGTGITTCIAMHGTMVLKRRYIKQGPPKEDPKACQGKEQSHGTEDPTATLSQQAKNLRTTPIATISNLTGKRVSYTIAKWVILRGMALIYFIAFLGALYQNEGIIGSRGLQPASDYFSGVKARYLSESENTFDFHGMWRGFCSHPTIFWIVPLSDQTMRYVNNAGLVLSTVVLAGINSWLAQLLLWMFYFSIVTIAEGTSFYSYGWESQVLETGFLAIFLCALPRFQRIGLPHLSLWEQRSDPPSPIILWLFSWLCFRISMGAGLIKLRGSSCWTDRTCLHFHFETQPLPSPLSYIYHFLPRSIQSRMVDTDLLVQVYTSWFVLIPVTAFPHQASVMARIARFVARVGGYIQAGFMVGIALSGNFAFLNHLTILPALACLDDACWPQWICFLADDSGESSSSSSLQQNQAESKDKSLQVASFRSFWRRVLVDIPLFVWILYISWPVVENLLQIGGTRQVMNRSFGSFRLVNTYGAFGSVGKARYEAIVQISDDLETWHELEFPCKPGNVFRTPCFCAPYHYRVDWNIWFLGFKPHQAYLRQRESWLFNLLFKILEKPERTSKSDTLATPATYDLEYSYHDRPWLALLDTTTRRYLQETYYENGRAPLYAKVDMYHYRMAASLWSILGKKLRIVFPAEDSTKEKVAWWKRHFEENLIAPLELSSDGTRLQLVKSP